MEPSATFGRGLSEGCPDATSKPHPLPDVANARPTSPSFAKRVRNGKSVDKHRWMPQVYQV